MAQLIDKEVQELIGTIYDKIRDLLLEHKDELEELAELLLNKEVAEKKDLEKILGKRKEMV
jgi:cell division protease FtsH